MSKLSQQELDQIIVSALEDVKGRDITKIDVTDKSDVMDTLIIVSGTSNRHVVSLIDNVVDEVKKAGLRPLGVEGREGGEWVLADFGGTVVHSMLPATRDFYDLERLWSFEPENRSQ